MWYGLGSTLLAAIMTFTGHKILDQRFAGFSKARKIQYNSPLYDVVHENTSKDWVRYRWVPDYGIALFVWAALFVWSYRWEELVVVNAILYCFRAIVFSVTMHPRVREPLLDKESSDDSIEVASPTAIHQQPKCRSWWAQFRSNLEYLLRVEGRLRLGNRFDNTVSGHVTMMTGICMHWRYYNSGPCSMLYIWIAAVLLSYLVILTRCHFFSDVILAWSITCAAAPDLRAFLHDWQLFDRPDSLI
jgi:hypothetical protein